MLTQRPASLVKPVFDARMFQPGAPTSALVFFTVQRRPLTGTETLRWLVMLAICG